MRLYSWTMINACVSSILQGPLSDDAIIEIKVKKGVNEQMGLREHGFSRFFATRFLLVVVVVHLKSPSNILGPRGHSWRYI